MNEAEFSQQVHARRRELGISQARLADLAGISRNYVSLIERGDAKNVSIGTLNNLASALGVSVGQLTGESSLESVFIPPALRQLAIQNDLQFEIVDRLARIPRRGLEPHSPEEWAELYRAVRPYLE